MRIYRLFLIKFIILRGLRKMKYESVLLFSCSLSIGIERAERGIMRSHPLLIKKMHLRKKIYTPHLECDTLTP